MSNPDRYAAFVGTSMRLWLRVPDQEIFVQGKGWVEFKDLAVGDVTTFGKVAFIGTEQAVKEFRDGVNQAYPV